MISSTLSCSTFGLPGEIAGRYLDWARNWAGQPSLDKAADGSVQWIRPTKLHVDGLGWLGTPDLDVRAQSALLPLGRLDQASNASVVALAYLSPFPSAAAAFKRVLPRLTDSDRDLSLAFDIDAFARHSLGDNRSLVRALEGRTEAGASISIAGQGREMSWHLDRLDRFHVKVVSVEVGGHTARIDGDFNVELDDMSASVEEVTQLMRDVFALARPRLSARPAPPSRTAF